MTTVPKLSLLGVLPAQVLLSQLDGGALAPPLDRSALLASWQASNSAYTSGGNPSRTFIQAGDLKQLPPDSLKAIQPVLARAAVYPPFDTHQVSVALVPTSKIVTPQLTVNLERLRSRGPLRKDSSIDDLVNYMFLSPGHPPQLTRQILGIAPNGGAILFTTYDEDVRLHSPPLFRSQGINERDPEAQELETMCFPVGGGTPFPYGMRIPLAAGVSRVVLANGIHRAAGAALAGVDRIPLILVESQPVEIPDPFVDTPRQLLLDPASNAPSIADFANPKVAMELQYFRQLRTVRMNWNVESYLLSVK